MDIGDLLLSCRKGDLEKVKYLVEVKDVDVNVRDRWDSTPLYYACLCGHIDLVSYLLDVGARCEANTFDGERCLYGALSPQIRSLLRNYKVVSTQIIRREIYHEFLRRLLECSDFWDIIFNVHGKEFRCHRCILSARSEFFHQMFTGKWKDRRYINIRHELVIPEAFGSVLSYLYTGQFEVPLNQVDDVLVLAKYCKLELLVNRLSHLANSAVHFHRSKPGTHVNMIRVEPPANSSELQQDFSQLAENALPFNFKRWLVNEAKLPFVQQDLYQPNYYDLTFVLESRHYFRAHKAFFCTRSEFFKALVTDSLGEREHEVDIEVSGDVWAPPTAQSPHYIPLTIFRTPVFIHLLYYIYQESVELDTESVCEVLMAADQCLLPGLKRQCGVFMAKHLDIENVIEALRTARIFDVAKLEASCYEFMADHIEWMVEMGEFHRIVCEDADQLCQRQEVDTIDIIDNIRYHLTAGSIIEAEQKLELIDKLLQELELDA